MNCKCCNQPLKSDIQFRFARRNGRIVTTDSYEIVTCNTPGCPAQYVTASVMHYDETIDAYLANPPKAASHA